MVIQKAFAIVRRDASNVRDHPTFNCARKTKSENVKCVLCEGNHPANYKGCTIYKDLQKRHFPTLWKKEITIKPQSQVEPARIQLETVQRGRTYASVTRTESSSSTVSQIHRATQERVVPSSPGQFTEKVMQVFQKELKEFMDKTFQKGFKEFMDKTSQLISGLMTVVTEKIQWKEN